MKEQKYCFVDLFAGAGGLSEGFLSEGTFNTLAHVEMNLSACITLTTRAAYFFLKEHGQLEYYKNYICGNISRAELYGKIPQSILSTVINEKISDETIDSIICKIDQLIKENHAGDVDLIIGGPPCQAYSLLGRATDANGMKDDPRNYLYKQYVRFLECYRPKVFVFENVPGILNANKGVTFSDILEAFEKVGYKADYQILDAVDYGVLQQRKRVIIVGWQKQLALGYPTFTPNKFDAIVNDLLNDLSPLARGQEKNLYVTPPTAYLLRSGIRAEGDTLTQHLCRYQNDRDVAIYKCTASAWSSGHKRLRYTDLPDELITRQNRTSFLDRYKVVAGDQPYSHTIIAHIAKDGHYFIHPDVNQGRSLSVREAARIQSFPDNYYFEGSRAAKFTQIGNAVPPLMGRAIARGIIGLLRGGAKDAI